jgi:hypothetical protein
MSRLNSFEVMERRQNISILLGRGLNGTEIATKLRENKDVIYKDIKAIKKQGSKFFKDMNMEQLGYFYNLMLTNLFQGNKILWNMAKETNTETSDADRIRAIKTINDITINLRETVKEGLNLCEIPELKQRLQKLEQINSMDNNKSFMNLELPYNKNHIPQ